MLPGWRGQGCIPDPIRALEIGVHRTWDRRRAANQAAPAATTASRPACCLHVSHLRHPHVMLANSLIVFRAARVTSARTVANGNP